LAPTSVEPHPTQTVRAKKIESIEERMAGEASNSQARHAGRPWVRPSGTTSEN